MKSFRTKDDTSTVNRSGVFAMPGSRYPTLDISLALFVLRGGMNCSFPNHIHILDLRHLIRP
jgi:hypothetical protein